MITEGLTLQALGFFFALALPGLVSMAVYRLVMPARSMEWGSAAVPGLFYGSVNFALLFPLIYYLTQQPRGPLEYWAGGIIVLLAAPAAWPFLLGRLIRSRWVAGRIQLPYPTVWDYFFDRRQPAFVLVHLTNGRLLGGYWGHESYAGGFPNDGDIYLQAVYAVTEDGRFGEPVPYSQGVLLRKLDYSYLELFEVPATEAQNAQS